MFTAAVMALLALIIVDRRIEDGNKSRRAMDALEFDHEFTKLKLTLRQRMDNAGDRFTERRLCLAKAEEDMRKTMLRLEASSMRLQRVLEARQ